MDDEQVILLIKVELARARRMHPHWPEDNKLLGVAIVCEESGEAIRAAVQYEAEDGDEAEMFREVIQTAATCIRFISGK